MSPHGGDNRGDAAKAKVATLSRHMNRASALIQRVKLCKPPRPSKEGLSMTKASAVRVKHVAGKERPLPSL